MKKLILSTIIGTTLLASSAIAAPSILLVSLKRTSDLQAGDAKRSDNGAGLFGLHQPVNRSTTDELC